MTKLSWGIIGTGAIAKTFARALPASKTGQLIAVASRTQASADAFAKEFAAPHAHSSYEAILNDPTVQAVYISTPHPMHAEWAIRCARAGKHILCEKPIAINHADAMAIVEAAIENDVFLMEAFMYRCHPQTARVVEVIKKGEIGEVRLIQAQFGFQAAFDPNRRLFNNSLAGGAILDVGCYPVSMARLIAGAAIGKDFSDPIDLKGFAHLAQTGVDEWAVATAKFPGEVVAQLSTAVTVGLENVVRVFGSEGQITLPNPWLFNRVEPDQGKTIIQRKGEPAREINLETSVTSYTFEADVVGNAILSGAKQAPSPAMSWDDSLGNIRTLDLWRESIGLTYESEQPAAYRKTTVSGSPLSPRTPPPLPGPPGEGRGEGRMRYGTIAGIDKPISRLVMGCDNQRTLAHSAIMFDDFFERGGTTFDTAWVYAAGLQEKLLGQWIKLRGVRDQVVIICKGAHTPFCYPKDLTRQMGESFERLQTDHAELYIMHRDNLEVPVGEFMSAMHEQVRSGRIKALGASNWTLPRFQEANEYARKNGLTPFSVLNNQFSLARMVGEIWKGCLSASDPESRAFLTKTQTTLLAWSSQARGFFLPGNAHPDQRDNDELVRTWYSDDNFKRLARANELAKKKNVLPINIALAYVLAQPFPTIALIGPRLLSETRTSFAALDIKLTEQEICWLDLQE